MKSKVYQTLRDYGIVFVGSIIYALAFDWLYAPNNIVMGGFTGLAQTIHHIVPAVPVGILVMALNIPLFIVGAKLRGMKLLYSSAFAIFFGSLFVDIFPQFIEFTPMEDQLLAAVFGGVLMGFSMGIQLWVGATTGGTELLASLLKLKFRHIQIGKICFAIDLAVIAIYTFSFGAINAALYAVIAVFLNSSAIDSVIYGRKDSKVAYIISSRGEALMDDLIKLELGITSVCVKGGFNNDDKKMLICAFKPSKITMIKSAVINIDPTAFVIVCDAHDVFGEGFDQCTLNSL